MENVKVFEDKYCIPTYELLEEDLNPLFDRKLNPYPYTLQNMRSQVKNNIEYKVVFLENEYLRLIVIPSLGGRLYSVLDKRNGKEVFYKNPVIKPRMIGTRGAWFSGGVEFNFPISHSPTTMDRVNYITREYEDGSASIIFGNIEHISGMEWKVELRLYPGKASIEENVRLYNPTAYENRFYFWTNAAIENNESVELIYPFNWCINNIDAQYIKWPYYHGLDLSKSGNMPFAYETFGKLLTENFFGIYNHDKNQGVVHYADRKILKGAKFFHWGNDSMAASWNRALTDDGSQYLEIQSGPFETQMVYKFLKPYQELTWSEYWYPVNDMQGFKYAEKEVAFNYEIKGNEIKLVFSAVEDLGECDIALKINDRVYNVKRKLGPEANETLEFMLEGPMGPDNRFELDIYNSVSHILSYGKKSEYEERPDLDLYEDSRVVMDEGQKVKLFKYALLKESLGETEEALKLYERNLKEYPSCTLTLNRLGRVYLKQMLWKEAEDCFQKVLQYDNRNSEARFLLALTEKEKGNIKKARSLFLDIAMDGSMYEASAIEAAKTDILLGYYREGAALLEKIAHKKNGYITFLLSICYRKDGMVSKALNILEKSKCANEFVYAEKFLFKNLCREADSLLLFTGRDERALIRIALEYMDLGLYEEAGMVLELVEKPGFKSILLKWYSDVKTGRTSGTLPKNVLNSPIERVFINEGIIVRILLQIMGEDSSGRIEYLLGTFYYSIGRREDALQHLLVAYGKGLRYTVLLRNLGYIYYNCFHDSETARLFFEKDLYQNNGINEDTIIYLDKIFRETGRIDLRKELLPYMEKAKNRSLVLIPLVETLRDTGEEDKALNILENEEFENWEGLEISGPCYRSVIISKALKEAGAGNLVKANEYMSRVDQYPENLNYGVSARGSLSDVYYHKGIICSMAGEEKAALEEFKKGAEELKNPDIIHLGESRGYCLKCLDELNKRNIVMD